MLLATHEPITIQFSGTACERSAVKFERLVNVQSHLLTTTPSSIVKRHTLPALAGLGRTQTCWFPVRVAISS
jgi:hypothetical protein